MSRDEPVPGVTIGLNHDGSLDEVVIPVCGFHLEQMAPNGWWMVVRLPDGHEVTINLFTPRATIGASVEVDQ